MLNVRSAARLPLKTFLAAIAALLAIAVALIQSGTFVASAQTATGFAIGESVVVTADSLNFRETVGLDSAVLSELPNGTTATVADGPIEADGYTWYALDVDGTVGWSVVDCLAIASGSTESASVAATAALSVTADALNLRETVGLGGALIAELPAGTAVTILDGPQAVDGYSWYLVETEYGTGWVAGDYLIGDSAATTDVASAFATGSAAAVNDDGLRLRETAGLSGVVVTELPADTAVTVIGGPVSLDGYSWYQVETASGTGWVAGEFLSLA